MADLIYRKEAKPEGAFRTDSLETKLIREAVLQKERRKEIALYTVSGSLDPLVQPGSSSLPIQPKSQFFSMSHEHLSPLTDPFLARLIGKRWLKKHTQPLPRIVAPIL